MDGWMDRIIGWRVRWRERLIEGCGLYFCVLYSVVDGSLGWYEGRWVGREVGIYRRH